ncbi:MAG: CPBP family intramembrane glutamic endopeptidase [Chloroflexota bacterium]
MFSQLMKRIAAAELPPPWSAWGAIGAMLASFLAIIIGSAISIIIGDSQYTPLLGWSLGGVLIIAFVWFTRRAPRYWSSLWNNASDSQPSSNPTQNIFWYLLIGVGLAILLDLIGRGIIGQIIPDPELFTLYGYVQLYGQPVLGISWVLVILFMVVLQPLAEGLVFQGMLLPSLRATVSPWAGFILAVAAYTMFHFVTYQSSSITNTTVLIWIGVLQPLISGLIFAAVRVYTGSTRAAILTHMAFGLFAVIKLLTLVSR